MLDRQADEDGLRNAPWYILFFVRVGIPTGFAMVLLWFLLTNVTGNLSATVANTTALATNDATIVANQGKIIELLHGYQESTNANTKFLQALCYNISKTDQERARCTDAAR